MILNVLHYIYISHNSKKIVFDCIFTYWLFYRTHSKTVVLACMHHREGHIHMEDHIENHIHVEDHIHMEDHVENHIYMEDHNGESYSLLWRIIFIWIVIGRVIGFSKRGS